MRKAFIPEFWITTELKGDALRTLFAVALHADKRGYSFVKNDTLAVMLGKDVRRVQADINRGELLGLLSRKFDEKGKRYFVINMDKDTGDGKQHPMTENNMTENDTPCHKTTGGDDELQQGGMTNYNTPPNNPHIGTLYSSTVSSHSIASSAREPVGFVPLSTIPIEPPIMTFARTIGKAAVDWVKLRIERGTDENDWRLNEILETIVARGTKPEKATYFAPMFKALPVQQPESLANATIAAPNQPKRITTKDGKKVLIDGQWLVAASEPIPNVMQSKYQPDDYGLVFTEISNRIADAKWTIDVKSRCLDKLFTLERTGSADSYRVKLEKAIEEVKDGVK